MSPNTSSNKTTSAKSGILRVLPLDKDEKSQKRVKFHENLIMTSPISVADRFDQDSRIVDNPLLNVSSKEMTISSGTEAEQKPTSGMSLKQFILAWTSMILAVIAASSIGPVFKYMESQGIGPLLAASWRCQCMVMFLVPLAIFEAWSSKEKRVDWFKVKPGLTFPVIVHLLFSGLAWAGNLLTWIVGLQYTTTFKASLIASSHPILLVFIMRFRGTQVSYLEWIGVFVSFGGMILSSSKDMFGSNEKDTEENLQQHKYEFLGFFLCFLAASFEVMVLFNRIATKKYVPLFQYTAGTTIVVATMASVSSLLLEGGTVLSSATAQNGIEVFCRQENCIFGWTGEKWVLKVTLFGLWVGVICIAGFNYAMQYIPPLIFSSCGLVDPAITAILSWAIGVESLPSLITWIGGFTVMTGVGVISVGDHYRTEEEHKQAAAAAAANGGTDPHVVDGSSGTGSETDSDKSSKSSGSADSSSSGDSGKGGITMSVLHHGRRFVSGGGGSSSSDGGKYSILGTDDDEDDLSFGGDIEQGSAKEEEKGLTAVGGDQYTSVSRGNNDDDVFGSSDVNLSAEEERMLQFIRSKTNKQQEGGADTRIGFAEV